MSKIWKGFQEFNITKVLCDHCNSEGEHRDRKLKCSTCNVIYPICRTCYNKAIEFQNSIATNSKCKICTRNTKIDILL